MAQHAIIVGGGIGGLTAALALDQIGWQVTVFEQANALSEIGAGVQISSNGMRVLDGLGVILPKAYHPDAVRILHGGSGRLLYHLPLGQAAIDRWGAPYVHIHRADLLANLVEALEKRQPGAIQLGQIITGYKPEEAAVKANGKYITANLIVGSDGLHSVLRQQMHGHSPPRFTGNVAWRCLVDRGKLGDHTPPPGATIWTGQGSHAVTTLVRSGDVVNFVGVLESDAATAEDWYLKADRSDPHKVFGSDTPILRKILEKTDQVYCWGLYDHAPLPHWSDGPVTLIGDAAHPMLPSMAQGAVQAIEDADQLAKHLSHTDDIPQACQSFYRSRIARVSKIQAQSSANLRLFHRRSWLSQMATYGPLWLGSRIAPQLIHHRNDWIYKG